MLAPPQTAANAFADARRPMTQADTAIELWLVDLERCAAALEECERDVPRLAADDLDRAGGIRDDHERRRRLAAHTALRVLLERMAGAGVRRQPFLRDPGGKPRLDDRSVAFSLSHTQGLALIGVTRSLSVGVDLEVVRPVKVARRRLDEISAVGAGLGHEPLLDRGTDRAFLQAWARMEAFAKADGRGVARTLADLGLRGKGRHLPLARVEAAARCLAIHAGLTAYDLELPPRLFGAVAATRQAHPTRVRLLPQDRAGLEQLLA